MGAGTFRAAESLFKTAFWIAFVLFATKWFFILKVALYEVLYFFSEASVVCAPARGLRVTKRLFASKKSRKGGEGAISFTLCGFI